MAVRSKLLWILCPLVLGAQTSGDLARIMERLDRLEKENRELSEQVRKLTEQLNGTPKADAQATETPPKLTPEQRLDIVENRVEEQAQTKVESSQKSVVRLSGAVLFNAYSNSRQSDSSNLTYPVVAPSTGTSHSGATVRQSIIGLEFQDPTAVLGGKAHGSVYMDFFSTNGTNNDFRVRTASVQIDWKTRSIAAGLEKPIFNPREPSSLAQLGVSPLTGAGNLWLWVPQVRFEQDLRFTGSTGVRSQLGVVQTRELGDYAGTLTAEANRPGLEGRFNFYHRLDEERRFELAAGFHTSTTHSNGASIPSHIFALDWFANPWKKVEFNGAFYTGTNVAHLGSGTRQGFGFYGTEAFGIESTGGWGQITIHPWPRWDLHFFTGQVDDANQHLIVGSIGKNLLYGGNIYFHIAQNVLTGFELTQTRTMYIGQGLRLNNHYDLALGYFF